MYLVAEIRTNSDGTIGIPPIAVFITRSDADARYYSILAAAAISNLPKHTAAIFTEEGN